jgi:hypothetical protein
MKESITAGFADVCIRVPATEADRVKAALSKFLELAGVQYSIPDDEDLLTWEEAFPELGPGDVLKGARDRVIRSKYCNAFQPFFDEIV